MGNEVTLYENAEFGKVRVVMRDGEPWFVAADVCRVLEIANPSDATSVLDEDERMTIGNTEGHSGQRGGAQSFLIISESGLYSFILRSNKPNAKAFSRWVRKEVLPSIRKTGSYGVRTMLGGELADKVAAARLIFETAFKDNQLTLALDKFYRSETGISALEKAGVVLEAPHKKQLLNPTDIGEQLVPKLSAKAVNIHLAALGYQVKVGKKWEPTDKGEEYALMQDIGRKYNNGAPIRQLMWETPIIEILQTFIDSTDE